MLWLSIIVPASSGAVEITSTEIPQSSSIFFRGKPTVHSPIPSYAKEVVIQKCKLAPNLNKAIQSLLNNKFICKQNDLILFLNDEKKYKFKY